MDTKKPGDVDGQLVRGNSRSATHSTARLQQDGPVLNQAEGEICDVDDRDWVELHERTYEGKSHTLTPKNEHCSGSSSRSSSHDSEATRRHLEELEDLEAGGPDVEEQRYHEEEVEDLPVSLPGNNEIAWGYHGHRRHRPTARPREDWVQEAEELESAIGSATGTRYYRVD
ncbi:hypothetical protein AB5N19_05833 [Seiridium cardinale]|uniref:Uncharacterized protein n=1 Tax=Seiridium cardinale TaxID=138064 RepID=A0ABR2XHK6_9PEZI